ncbi:molybdopterin synthase sulfur carrier subunit isoform X2 [Oreochromis niloticus]|uniref:molybdopterin synthase sulfur carrier subunit isoform X2 n=1 Tax=Oreochromis niloticus TaxID=8128 RepID=UPI0006741C2B|nr:molybdopterin synthase sulfur carrier subunit isoform X2 [Oreochromis niloticus]
MFLSTPAGGSIAVLCYLQAAHEAEEEEAERKRVSPTHQQLQTFLTCSSSARFFMTAQVCVLYFAKSVELTGVKEEKTVAVPTPISSHDLWKLLVQRHPRLCTLQDGVVLAVRQEYVPIGDQVLTLGDGDEVAVVPPLSGG